MTASVSVREWAAGGEEHVAPLAAFTSPCPHPWWRRDDPYWQPELFEDQPRWQFNHRLEEDLVPNVAGRLVRVRNRVPDFTAITDERARARRVVAALGALGQFHQLTTGQLAAMGGWSPKDVGRVLTPLWQAGLLERARLRPQRVVDLRPDLVWRLRIDGPLRDWVRGLDDRQWATATLGLDLFSPGAGRNHLRHNLLAAEASLRALETVPGVRGAWGESLCDPGRLLPPWHRSAPGRPLGWRADAALLRADGMRVALEVVYGTVEAAIRPKLARWARLLADWERDDSGLVVVFVNAAVPGRHEVVARSLRKLHTEVLSPEGLGRDGMPASAEAVRRARSQVLLASWQEWFPALWAVGDAFRALRVAFTVDGRSWRYGELGPAGLPFRPTAPDRWGDAVVNVSLAAHTPRWAGGPVVSTLDAPEDLVPG